MKKTAILSLFTLTMINIAAIGSVKNWPLIAEYGLSSISYLLLASLVFFLPIALITAELATTWPEQGGIYAWIKHAFGHKTAFLAVWLFWLLNVIWYPTLLSLIAVSAAYLFDPALTSVRSFTLPIIILSFWASTFANLLGMKISGWVSTLGALFGTFIPGILVVILSIIWWISAKPSDITFTLDALIPPLNSPDQMVFFVGILLSLCGIEMSAVHAADVRNPEKNYPKAIIISGIVIISFSILGVLGIATVVPQKNLSLVSGALQAFSSFLNAYKLAWMLPLISLFMLVGAFGSLTSWVAATSRALLAASKEGDLPPYFLSINRKKMPSRLLIAQAILVSVVSLLFAVMPTLSQAFWVLSALVAQLYIIIYIILLCAAIKLRHCQPHVTRPFKIPGGKIGIWCCASLGLVSCLFAIFIGFFTPSQLKESTSPWTYATILAGSIILACLAPSIILLFQKPHWKKNDLY